AGRAPGAQAVGRGRGHRLHRRRRGTVRRGLLMASTVKIPGVGTVPTKYAVAGGVVVVVIAGVAWVRFANSRAQEEDLGPVVDDYTGVAETIYPAYSTDYAPDGSYYGGAYPYPTYTTPSYGLTTTVQTPDP